MKTNIKIILSSAQSIVLMVAVLMSGAHAEDIVKASSEKGAGTAKVHAELHNHIEKQTVKHFGHGTDTQQADRRSLQQLKKEAQDAKLELKFGTSLWLRMLAAKLML